MSELILLYFIPYAEKILMIFDDLLYYFLLFFGCRFCHAMSVLR